MLCKPERLDHAPPQVAPVFGAGRVNNASKVLAGPAGVLERTLVHVIGVERWRIFGVLLA